MTTALEQLGLALAQADPGELAEFLHTLEPDEAAAVLAAVNEADVEQFIAGRKLEQVRAEVERDGPTWMRALFPQYAKASFAPHMRILWEWVWSIERGSRPRPHVDIWFRGGTKALAVETPIPTPHGWTTMGDLQPGATVYDHAGRPVRVTGVSEVEERDSYRVAFKSGEAIIASGDHLWCVAPRRVRAAWAGAIPEEWPTWTGTAEPAGEPCAAAGCDRSARTGGLCSAHYERRRTGRGSGVLIPRTTRGRWERITPRTMTTTDMLTEGLVRHREYQWGIPTAGALEAPDAWLPIDPYLLGAWLGDGTSRAGQITVGPADEPAMRLLLAGDGRRTTWHQYGSAWYVTIAGLRRDLRLAGLLGDKHVPTPYLRAGVKQRLGLLQGLMDTDGTPSRGGGSFVSTRQVLTAGVAELARSLGLRVAVSEGRATLDGRDCGPIWTARIAAATFPLFRLGRKERAQMTATRGGGVHARMHYVTGIEPVGTRRVKCITVDSPSRCFLAGTAMIPTHNSTSGEAAAISLGARGKRRYALYISGTQDQADKHVSTIGSMLESKRVAAVYPEMAERAVSQYGGSKGWSRQRLWTRQGFVIDALGLQASARGIRIEEDRPDLIILDDIDEKDDGPAMVRRKIELLTSTILPAGSTDMAVLAVQNIIHPNSIFARLAGLADEEADFLADRIVSGPIPAIRGLDVMVDETGRHVVVGGEPTWEGYGLDAAQAAIDTFGYTSFLEECQHLVKARPGGMFSALTYQRCKPEAVPPLIHRTCWVDPAVTANDGSDSQGIQIDGMDERGVIYRLWSWEAKMGPLHALTRAIRMAMHFGSPVVGVETDQGGDTWESVYREAKEAVRTGKDGREPLAGPFPAFREEKAGSSHQSKAHRASQMLTDYEVGGRIVHVEGTHEVLEAALYRFPRSKPYDLTDAAYWSWWYLHQRRGFQASVQVPMGTVTAPPINSRPAGGAPVGGFGGMRLPPVTRLR